MPTLDQTPGVPPNEVPAAGRPIEGVATSVAAFVGLAPGGPVGTPTRVTSWVEFARIFGGGASGPYIRGGHLAHAVHGFFSNGGMVCYVVRIDAPAVEPVAPVAADALQGEPETMLDLAALDGIDEITIVCVPDLTAVVPDGDARPTVQQEVENFCRAGQRMAIHDAPPALDRQGILAWRAGINTHAPVSTVYWPWIRVFDPVSQAVVDVPPCGHVAGVWAGTDSRHGVHKAPANQAVSGAVGVAAEVSTADQAALNAVGINVIRHFPGRGIRIWGARTLATETEPEWRYLHVRRLLNYISASILKGTDWSVIEPNDEVLWGKLRMAVAGFLTRVWRSGALAGAATDEAFFVKCDRDTNPPQAAASGQVNIQIGIAPVNPGEFVTLQISRTVGER